MSLEYSIESEWNAVGHSENPVPLGSERGGRSGVTAVSPSSRTIVQAAGSVGG